jgi:hypothetical protein
MKTKAVNAGWGPNGAAHLRHIWLYKGGGNCHHRWNKQVYAVLSGKALNITEQTNKLAQAKAAQYGYKSVNPKLVSTRPIDMPKNGFLPSNPQPRRTITR